MGRTLGAALRDHWPEYLIEAWALGLFMVSAGVVTTAVEAPGSALRAWLPDPLARRLLIGLAMGATAVALVYSPWGRRSGAHMNPAVTLTFTALGRTRAEDALFYVLAQFAGGTCGVLLAAGLLGDAFTLEPVRYVATRPGSSGDGAAFLAEMAISAALMATVLASAARPRIAPYTGLLAGCLVVAWITFEAPVSGMSMNPARSFASAAPAGLWDRLWIYFTAPVAGMLGAAGLLRLLAPRMKMPCAKLRHTTVERCIHCGYEPPARLAGRSPLTLGGRIP